MGAVSEKKGDDSISDKKSDGDITSISQLVGISSTFDKKKETTPSSDQNGKASVTSDEDPMISEKDSATFSEKKNEAMEEIVSMVSMVSHVMSPAEDSKTSSSIIEQKEDAALSNQKDESSGVLQVTVVEATDLVNKDMVGKSDPYVIVKFQDQEFRSPTVKNSLSPKWNFLSSFKVSSGETDKIRIDVYDDDYGKDDSLGSLFISVADALSEKSSPKWFDLKDCKTGKVSLSFEFTEETEKEEQNNTFTSDKKDDSSKDDDESKSDKNKDKDSTSDKTSDAPTSDKKEDASTLDKKGGAPTSDKKDDVPAASTSGNKDEVESASNGNDIETSNDINGDSVSIIGAKDDTIHLSGNEKETEPISVKKNDSVSILGEKIESVMSKKEKDISSSEKKNESVSVSDKKNEPTTSFEDKVAITSDNNKKELPSFDEKDNKPSTTDLTSSNKNEETCPSPANNQNINTSKTKITDSLTSALVSSTNNISHDKENVDSSNNKIKESETKQEVDINEDVDTSVDSKEDSAKYGLLQLTVVEAADLVNKDMVGKSDPYVIVKFQDQEFRSPTVKNNLSPKWNFLSSFNVSSDETEHIQFHVYDDDALRADDPLGSFSISVADALNEASNPRWFDLKDSKTGKVSVSFEFREETEKE